MTFPVFVEASQGQFTAQLVGAPFVQVVGTTRDQALAALRAAVQERVRTGELTWSSKEVVESCRGVSDRRAHHAQDNCAPAPGSVVRMMASLAGAAPDRKCSGGCDPCRL
jgi:hypothetical protein